MLNRYPGTCKTCKTSVPAEKGVAEKVAGTWTVRCARCSGGALADALAAKSGPATITARLDARGHFVAFKPSGFLGDRFGAYKAACKGAQYDGQLQANLAPLDKAGEILTALAAEGFALDVASDVRSAIEARVERARALVTRATQRTAEVGERLAARGKALFPYQRSGTAWLASRSAALLSDEMGLGKTVQALAALPEGAAAVVVCPAVAKGVWRREAAAWRPDLRVTVLSGKGSFRWPAPGEIVVVNYDILPAAEAGETGATLADEALAAACPAGVHLVADEAHALKSSKAKRTASFRALSAAARSAGGVCWLITATPLLNRGAELWALLQAAGIAKEAFGSWATYMHLMGGYQGGFGIEWGNVREPEEVGRRLSRVMLRRLRAEVLPELPRKRYTEITVDLDAKTAKLCDRAVKSLAARGLSLADLDAVVSDTADGAGFEELSQARSALSAAKINAAIELVQSYEEAGEPVVVFSAYRQAAETLGSREGWATITGETSPEERTRIEEAFQAGKLRGVAGTIKAMGVAITLVRACNAVFVDCEWTPALNAQAEDRICRLGQTRPCQITVLVGDHGVDRRVADLLAAKRAVIDASVERAVQGESVVPQAPDSGVDFDRLAELAREQAAEAAARRAEAEALAAELVAASDAEREAVKARHEQEAKERAAARYAERRERAKARGYSAEDDDATRRPARTARELWAAEALVTLSSCDDDHARFKNETGFNKPDSANGHWLRTELEAGLTDLQWKLAVEMCRKYQGQVGPMPERENAA
jgi:SWI/SNF-related matrix-associated actin-dependent regulator 1 of chromatin subfamily A